MRPSCIAHPVKPTGSPMSGSENREVSQAQNRSFGRQSVSRYTQGSGHVLQRKHDLRQVPFLPSGV
jgi:hypothetical protein